MSLNTSMSSRAKSAALSLSCCKMMGYSGKKPCNRPAVKMLHSSEFLYINEGLCTVPEGTVPKTLSRNVVNVLAQ